jgi:hypothetical protein
MIDEINDVFFSNFINAKIIHHECETDGPPFVLSVARCNLDLGVSSCKKAFFNVFLHDDWAGHTCRI